MTDSSPALPSKHPLAGRVVEGDVRALARSCRLVDDGVGAYRDLLRAIFPHTGKAWTIGVTGMPGAGKSTLTNELIAQFRADDKRVAVLAVDPTSPFSGGAILGDRIRMQRHFADTEVFIRSLATRGALGGLSRSAVDLIRLCDAWGADVVIVETVGVGQDELEVTRTVDSTVVVMAPGMGDDIQAIKAGILECADVFAVNKADREGADTTARQLELMLSLGHSSAPKAMVGHAGHHGSIGDVALSDEGAVAESAAQVWTPPIKMCVATKGEGVVELLQELAQHRSWLYGSEAGARRRLERLREAMRTQLRHSLICHAIADMGEEIEKAVVSVARRESDPYTAAEALVAAFTRRQ